MTLLNYHELAAMRDEWRNVHSSPLRVKIRYSSGHTENSKFYESEPTETFKEFDGFIGTATHILSAKLGRVFRERLDEEIANIGEVDTILYYVQFVSGDPVIEVVNDVSDNVAPNSNILRCSSLDFTDEGVRVGAKVVNNTDGSSAFVTMISGPTLTTTVLTGGTDNLFESGDSFTVYNLNDLTVDDFILINDVWRRICAIIPDTEGVQTTVLVRDV